ncbi:MAG: hypothetical protein JST78_05775 [Bacteroidetes bacterium]|nr:hypothetical protein [Bacteroidota bacterium]
MKKYFLSGLFFLAVINFVLLSCAAENDSDATDASVPTIVTNAAQAVNKTTATCGGKLISNGHSTILARGVCYALSSNPTIDDHVVYNPGANGTFNCTLVGLQPITQYFYRAFAKNSKGIAYGAVKSFTTTETTIALPTVTTTAVTDVTETSAITGGEVTSAGGGTLVARGICWADTPNPSIANNVVNDATLTVGTYTSNLTNLVAGTTYYVRAFATNSGGTGYGTQVTFTTTGTSTGGLATVVTTAASSITETTASSGGEVTADGGSAITARGICWAETSMPTTSDNTIPSTGTTGVFTSDISGLTANTTYYVRAYAINSTGTAYGNEISFTTTGSSSNGPVGGDAICDGSEPTIVVPITSSTGKIWMDRNLGASRAATSPKDYEAYGCLYQWGRGSDGHASINWVMGENDAWGNPAGTAVNGVTTTLANSDAPTDDLFIADQGSMPYDWRSPKNDNLWQGVSGTNNPCPAGYRIPTKAEFQAEISAYSITGPTAAYNSIHKFPTAGERAFDSGVIRGQGQNIFLWTSTVSGGDSYDVLIQVGGVYTSVANARASGFSVRCIKN